MESENNDLKRIFSGKDLAKLIFPLVIELMLTLLVGMIDSVMVSSAGEAAVSGVSLVDTVFQLLIYIFSAFGTGGAVVAGQYLGAGQKNNAKETAQQLVWFSAFSSIVIMVLIYLIRGFLLGHVYGAITQEVHWNANRYLMIVGLSIPALSVYESGAAIFRTIGNSKITMMLSAIMNVVNICGNALLIYVFKMGTAGAATVVVRYTAAVIMILLLLRTNHPLYLQRTLKYIPDGNKIKRILQIGVPNGIENGLFQVGKIILAGLFTHFGTSAITANAVCLTISGIQVIPGSAISLAATTVIARCVGAGDVRFAMITSVASMFVFRLGAAYLFALTFGMGALGIWYAMLCDWGFRAIVFSLRWISGGWKNKSII